MENKLKYPEQTLKPVVVIGAGISGLCVAHWLKQKDISVTLLEKESQPGGTMKTLKENGWLVEMGPNSALETTPLIGELISDLDLKSEHVYANESADKRYVVRNGFLHPIPMSFGKFLSTRLWTSGGKLQLLKEPFVGKALKEESVAEFVRRRLGREFLDYAIDPFVAGVYAGDPDKLSVRTAFPKLYALEEKYGGLVKGMFRSRKERKERKELSKDRARLFSFVNGMQILPLRIAAELGESVKFNCTVRSIVPMRNGNNPVYTITYYENDVRKTTEADVVVLSSTAYSTANIIQSIDPGMAQTLESIYYPPVAEVFLGFEEKQIGRPLDGFGYLVPRVEHRNILGTIWSSTLFPYRAPDNHVALTSFVGGARQPELAAGEEEQIINLVIDELKSTMGIEGFPVYTKIIRWEKAIPQYNLGYFKVLNAIDRFEANFRGAFISSNFRGGIAVGDCIMNADKTVEKISQYLNMILSK